MAPPAISLVNIGPQNSGTGDSLFAAFTKINASVTTLYNAAYTENYVNVVTDYQADNTGATDATAAIQAAFNGYPGGFVSFFFPSGLYKISSSLVINANAYYTRIL